MYVVEYKISKVAIPYAEVFFNENEARVFIDKKKDNPYLRWIELCDIGELKREKNNLQDKIRRRNMQIKELKQQMEMFTCVKYQTCEDFRAELTR